MPEQIEFFVNGTAVQVAAVPDRPLLFALREDLGLTGAKVSCGEGACGACTVLVDDRPVRACITPVTSIAGTHVLTIEGLAATGQLHPLQRAFLDQEAFQCGYCTPGMIMSALGLLIEHPTPSDEAIVSWMNGNICRCGVYSRIVRAIQQASALENGTKGGRDE